MSTSPYHAVVFGASGNVGYGVVDELLRNYPTQGTFGRVTALSNRALNLKDCHWPDASSSTTPKFQQAAGVNLTEGTTEEFVESMRSKVDDVASVTHIFYMALSSASGPQTSEGAARANVELNVRMLDRVIAAFEALSPNLKMIVFPSGAMQYGIHTGGGFFKPPFREDVGRLPPPNDAIVQYYAFRDLLAERCKGKGWGWADVCPDAVIGFTPNGSAYSLAAHWATYLSVYAAVEGKGSEIPFPGTMDGWNCLFNEVGSDMLARAAIWAALHPNKASGQTFNVSDQDRGSAWNEKWPKLAAYFGLKGVGPKEGFSIEKGPFPGPYIAKHKKVLEENGIKPNDVFKAEFLDLQGYIMTFDRHFDVSKIRAAGFSETRDPIEGWYKTFDKFKQAGLLLQ